MTSAPTTPRYSSGEEIANSVSHGVGIALSIAGLAVMVAFSALEGSAWRVVASSIFGATLVLTYSASTVYHAVPWGRAKRVCRILDHSAIFLLIAGTYTPFTLVNLRGPWGWTLFALIWGLTILGIVLTATAMSRFRVITMVLYIAMGWLIAIAVKPMLSRVGAGGLWLLLLGGVAYTVGLAFYGWRRMPYHHAVWHLFVLTGSVLHFFAVLFYVVLT